MASFDYNIVVLGYNEWPSGLNRANINDEYPHKFLRVGNNYKNHLGVDFSYNINPEIILGKTEISPITYNNSKYKGIDTQSIKMTFTIKAANIDSFASYKRTIYQILNDSINWYKSDLRSSVTRSDNTSKSVGSLDTAEFLGSGPVNKGLGDLIGMAGVLTIKAAKFNYGVYYDVIDGSLELPSNILDYAEISTNIAQSAVLNLVVIAGGRGNRCVLDQRLPYGNFEYPFVGSGNSGNLPVVGAGTFNLQGWDFGAFNSNWNWGTVYSTTSNIPARTATFTQNNIVGKFGKHFLFTLGSGGAGITATSPRYMAIPNEIVKATWGIWLNVPVANWTSGNITITFEIGEYSGGAYVWGTVPGTTPRVISSPSELTAYKWVNIFPKNGNDLEFVSIFTDAASVPNYDSYRLKINISCSGGGWAGIAIDGAGIWCFEAGYINTIFSDFYGYSTVLGNHPEINMPSAVLGIEEYVQCPAALGLSNGVTTGNGDQSYVLYGVQGDMQVPCTIDLPQTINNRNLAIVGEMPYTDSENETPVRMFDMQITTANNPGSTGVVTPTNGFFTGAAPYWTTAAGTSRDFLLNLYKDRLPRNYQLWVIYASSVAATSVSITMGGEVQVFGGLPNTYAPTATPGVGNFIAYMLGEWQFPQPNHNYLDKVQLLGWTGKPQDKITVNYTATASTYFSVAGVIALPANTLGMIDLTSTVSTPVYLSFSNENNGYPVANGKALSGVTIYQEEFVLPIPLSSIVTSANYNNPNFALTPSNAREYKYNGQIFSVLTLPTKISTNAYVFNGTNVARLRFKYTPRYVYPTNKEWLH